jgi:uncharacterized protein
MNYSDALEKHKRQALSTDKTDGMNRRLRKKKRLGEFREFGFLVRFRFAAKLSMDERNALLDDWIRSAIEANGLLFGGGGRNSHWEGFVTLDRRGSATEGHREAVNRWLKSESRVSEFEVGPLVDAWHGWRRQSFLKTA